MVVREIIDHIFSGQEIRVLVDDSCIYSGKAEMLPYWIAEMELPGEAIEARDDIVEISVGEIYAV